MKHLQYIVFLLTTSFIMTSCGEDRSGEYYALVGDNMWIEETMKEYYLWYDQMPEVDKDDYFDDADDFLDMLIYSSDNYSYVETKSEATGSSPQSHLLRSSTYGFEFDLMSDPTGTTSHTLARVMFVLPDSPASEAGLERGDWIAAVDGTRVTSSNYSTLMSGSSTTFARDSLLIDEDGNAAGWMAIDTLEIGASQTMELNPFYVNTVFTVDGTTIAYMMYNEFCTSADNQPNDEEYQEQMKNIFTDFKSQSPDAFILDLRYNPGGYLSCANNLASYLVPSSALGETFCTLLYNDITSPQEESLLLDSDLSSLNLNLSTLYVITSSFTASAAEALIHCLRPYMNIVVIGETTEGQNVAVQSYESDTYDLILFPVVAYVMDANRDYDYADGIDPDYELSESDVYTSLYPLGDTNEYLLKNTIEYITTGSMSAFEGTETESASTKTRVIYNSMSRRSIHGIRLK